MVEKNLEAITSELKLVKEISSNILEGDYLTAAVATETLSNVDKKIIYATLAILMNNKLNQEKVDDSTVEMTKELINHYKDLSGYFSKK